MPDFPTAHIVDDDPAIRDSLAFLLEANGYPARTYASAVDFLTAASGILSGCVITDVRMPNMSGLELLTRLRQRGSNVPVIVITGHGDIPLAVEAMRAGASDFIEKPFEDSVILDAVRNALEQQAARRPQEEERAAILQRMAGLSKREAEVLEGVAGGRPNKVIAYDLGISVRTVEVYRANVMSKMQAKNLSDLVRMWLLATK